MMLPQNFISFFIAFAVFCGAMFIIHSIAAPLVNRISNATASVTNGLYVSFYYSGGALGSYLPGLVYQGLGQQVFFTFDFKCVFNWFGVSLFRQSRYRNNLILMACYCHNVY